MYTYKTKIDGADITLNLTDIEIKRALSIIEGKGIDAVCIMKNEKGGVQMFSDNRKAIACQEKHKFDYMFTIKKADLKAYSNKAVKKSTNTGD